MILQGGGEKKKEECRTVNGTTTCKYNIYQLNHILTIKVKLLYEVKILNK